MYLKLLLLLSVTFFFTGCGNLNSVYRSFDINDGGGALIDIKQRAIIAKKKNITNFEGNIVGIDTIVCAEPSPDALSAYAAEIAGKVNVPEQVGVELAYAMNEGSSFVGLRTQSIQLLRDAMYRLCESHLNGAIDKQHYGILSRRYQKYMVALLSIEQLTGTIKTPTVVINSQGRAEASRSLTDMRDEIAKIDEKLEPHTKTKSELQTKNKELEEEKVKAKTDADKKKIAAKIEENNKKLKEVQSQITPLEKDKEAISNGIESARGVAAEGSTVAVISNVGIPASRSDEHIQAVAKTVEKIVLNVLDTDDYGQLCLSYLADPHINPESVIFKRCDDYLEAINKGKAAGIQAGIKAADKLIKQLQEESGDEKEIAKSLEKIISTIHDGMTVKSVNQAFTTE